VGPNTQVGLLFCLGRIVYAAGGAWMRWSDEDHSDLARQVHREHELFRAQVQDARDDVRLWLRTALSKEEQFYLNEMAESLEVLERIAETLVAGYDPNGEHQHWDTCVGSFLDGFYGAKALRGEVVGTYLGRLVAYLEQEVETRQQAKAKKGCEPTRIGQNIGKFKEECGWTYDDLAAKTGIDRKQIFHHVQGRATPRPRTLKEYAQAFAKELGRSITPADLKK
jgi:hypothetical protein